MDAVLTEQSIAASTINKQNRTKAAKKIGRGTNFISNNNPCENFDTYAGILNPPSRAMSFSYSHSLGQNHQQPPLLPLPPQLPRSVSGFDHRTRTREISLTPKKSKPTKREEAKKRSGTQSFLIVASDNNRWGPDPKDLPKNLPVVLLPGTGSIDDLFSDSVFNLAPPPSSLPLPKFSLRSKLSCNKEATAGSVDAGATNNLRRILRLR